MSYFVREFCWEDLDRYTKLYNEVSNLTDTVKYRDTEYMRQFLSQPSIIPEENCFIAETNNGQFVGFALVSNEKTIDRAVTAGGVVSSHRYKGVEEILLERSVSHANYLDVSLLHIEISSSEDIYRNLLEEAKFQYVKNYWQMMCKREDISSVEIPTQYSFRLFKTGIDEQQLTDLQNKAFEASWGFCPNTVEEISARTKMKDTAPEGIIFLDYLNYPSAYVWTQRISKDNCSVGSIGMTGVHPDYRGRGLGRAVVAAGIAYLKSQDVNFIELEVDAENVPARELYLSFGFDKIGQTVWYEKRL